MQFLEVAGTDFFSSHVWGSRLDASAARALRRTVRDQGGGVERNGD